MTHARSELHQQSPTVEHENDYGDKDPASEDLVSEVRVTLSLIGLAIFVVLPALAALSLLW